MSQRGKEGWREEQGRDLLVFVNAKLCANFTGYLFVVQPL